MRPATFASLAVALGAACSEPDTQVIFAQVSWMEWPAEVLAGESFSVRILGYQSFCREILRFDPGASVDLSAVTFEPFFLVSRREQPCPLLKALPAGRGPFAPFFDTRAPLAGLTPQTPRSYEMRAAAEVAALAPARDRLPVRTFGQITVRSDTADRSRTGAAGWVFANRDSTGCVQVYVAAPGSQYQLENPPPDTATFWSAFVRGYIHKAATPVCGASVVFHLESRN